MSLRRSRSYPYRRPSVWHMLQRWALPAWILPARVDSNLLAGVDARAEEIEAEDVKAYATVEEAIQAGEETLHEGRHAPTARQTNRDDCGSVLERSGKGCS